MTTPGSPSSPTRNWQRVFVGAVIVLAIAGAGAAAWEGWLQDRLIAKRWGAVEPGRIYRSGQVSAALVRSMLETHRIRMIVQLMGTGDPQNYVAALAAIHEAEQEGKPVLVHCHAGSQRTGGVVACYRVLFQGRSAEEAVAEMERFAWHRGRDDILLAYLNEHLPEIVQGLTDRGLIKKPTELPVFR
jgi:hypothetical protein